MAGNKRVYVSADKVFKDIVSEILVSDNYLDALEIKEVGSQLSFTRLEQFRTIQQYNKKVDSLVDSYVYTRALYFYSELEKLILDTFTIWLKLDPPPTNFEEIGIGNLMRCSKIMKLFGFDAQASRHNLYEPDRKKILQLVQAHCLAEGDNLNIYNNKLDDFVKNGVRDCMPCHCVLAFAFDGRELFYAFRGSFLAFKKKNSTDFNMKENMNRIHLEYVQGKKMALQHSFKEMVSKNSPRSFSQEVDKCQRIVRDYIGKMPEYQSLKKSLRSMDTYSRLLYLLYHRYFTLSSHGVGKESDGTGNGEAHLGSDEHTVLQEQLFLCTWYDIYNGKTELGKLNLLYKYDFVAYMAVFCVASLSYCLSSCPFVFLVSQEEDTNEDSAEYIIRILRSQYTDDIPDFALDQLEELLGETVNAGSGRVEYTAKGKVTKVQLDYEALLLNATARIVQKRVQAPEGVALDLRKLTASGCLIACPYCKQRKANVMQHVKDCHPTKLDTTDPSRFRTTLTWSDPSNAVVDAAKSSHIKIPQDKFIAAATAIILFHRIMFVENVAPHPSDSKILAIKFETFVEKTLQDKGEQELEMDSLLSNLQVLESGLKEELNVPSMECTGLGSFLTLINKPYQSTLLKRLFSLKVMVGNESDNQSLEAGNKSMVSFPSLNVDALHVVLDDIVNHMPPFTNLAPLKLLAYIQQSIQDNDENCSNFVDQMLEAANQDADLAAKLAVVFQSVSPINQATDMVEEDGVKSSLEWMQNSVAFEVTTCLMCDVVTSTIK
ncbi:hypothetical protein EON65_00490 [archaeon]|nr:MAG: hypothetical protein EON65_00490 [archaeon]